MGRPAKWNEPSEIISVRIPQSWAKAINKMAAKSPAPELIRDAIMQFLKRNKML